MKVFAIYDIKAGAFLQPFFSPTRATGMRAFSDAVAQEQQFQRWPTDYELFEIGDWEPNLGKWTSEDRTSLGMANDYIVKDN